MRTVLVFAHECAPHHRPESSVGAQRPAQFARHLAAFGWRAIVVCCDVRARGAGCPSDLEAGVTRLLREADPGAPLIVPTPSLPYDGVLDRLWRAALPAPGRGRARALLRRPLTMVKQLTGGDYSQAWRPCARRAAEVVARETRIDVVMAEHTPDAGLFLARWFAARHDVPWIADFRDPILDPFNPLLRRLYAPVARRLLRGASHTVAVNDYLAKLDREFFGLPSTSIPNGFEPEEFAAPLPPEPLPHFTVAYTGSLHPAMRPEPFFEGLRILRDRIGATRAARVRFVYRGVNASRVEAAASAAGVHDLVDAGEHVAREKAFSIIRRADVLLLLSIPAGGERDIYHRRGLYPGKTFDYFGARRPILAVPGDGAMLDELLVRSRTGVVAPDPESIADYLEAALAAWERGERVPYAPDEAVVGGFTRSALAARLADVLDQVVGERDDAGESAVCVRERS